MKSIWKYILAGIIVAVGGMFVSDLAGDFFNGLGDYGFGCILGFCMYLCIVIVTCTGIIITKLNKSTYFEGGSDKQSKWYLLIDRADTQKGGNTNLRCSCLLLFLFYLLLLSRFSTPQTPVALPRSWKTNPLKSVSVVRVMSGWYNEGRVKSLSL